MKSAESGDSVTVRPRSRLMSDRSPRPSGKVGNAKVSRTVSLPPDSETSSPAPAPPGRKPASACNLLKIDFSVSSAEP